MSFMSTLCTSQDCEVTDSKCEDKIAELEEQEQILQEVVSRNLERGSLKVDT